MSAKSKNQEARRTCVFHSNWMQVAKTIADMKVRCIFYEAALQYAFDGTKIDTPPELELVLTFVYGLIDEDVAKYQRICERRAEAGRKGGAPKGNQNASKNNQNQAIQANACFDNKTSKNNQNKPTDTDTDTDTDILNENNKKEIVSKKKAASAAALEKRKRDFYESLLPYREQYDKDLLQGFFSYWSESNKSQTKMKFELERTFEVGMRLARWANHDTRFSKN